MSDEARILLQNCVCNQGQDIGWSPKQSCCWHFRCPSISVMPCGVHCHQNLLRLACETPARDRTQTGLVTDRATSNPDRVGLHTGCQVDPMWKKPLEFHRDFVRLFSLKSQTIGKVTPYCKNRSVLPKLPRTAKVTPYCPSYGNTLERLRFALNTERGGLTRSL